MRRPSAAVIALIVFALVDVGLSWAAIRSTRAKATPNQSVGVAPSGSSNPSSVPSAATATTASSTAAAQQQGKVIVVGLSGDRAWRAATTATTCSSDSKRARISHTDDGGSSWTRVDVPMTTVSSLSYDAGKIIAIGLDTSCDPVAYALKSSADPAKTSTAPAWAVSPTDSSTLEVGGDPAGKQPCTGGVLDVAANSNSSAAVLCAGGDIELTDDGGQSWDSQGTVQNAAAISTTSQKHTIFVASRADCGVAVASLSHTLSGDNASCVDGTKENKGPIDLTIVGNTMWLTSNLGTVTEAVSDLG